ncbi:MAG: phosphoribosylamine--glycine ligase [Deltaproteobacteria bacterium]|nr:phosphoribosylamine--glycine ligase [Deltaproteobacteria bacterium]MBI4223784.1 phosphoribosylamine--glycine ligase [Deltaproteobacteria bacterium]
MNLLVIGSGGREHALVWKLAASPRVKKLYCAPGNAGIARQAECADIAAADISKLLTFAKEKQIDLTIVGPEAPLAAGLVDAFKKEHLNIFGPTKEAAKLEASKIYTKEFCGRYQIPQAGYKTFTNPKEAKAYVETHDYPLVVKADGLAQGKGVAICQKKEEALAAIQKYDKIVIEDFLKGEEASFIAVVDGNHILPLASSKDHKRLLDGERGPNTGGMGAFSPSPLINREMYEKIMETIMIPAVRAMVTEGFPFVGFLYAGLMIAKGEPRLLEFNVRLGDPEAQAILPRLRTDLVEIFQKALDGRLNEVELSWETDAACCVVMASQGYPGTYEKGLPIQGLNEAESLPDTIVFHAGTRLQGERVVTEGGRVLGVSALGKNVAEASQKAYTAAEKISWKGSFYRKDIGRGVR